VRDVVEERDGRFVLPLAESVVADRAVVLEAIVSATGTLEVTFSGGRVLAVSPLEDVEAWEVRGPGDVNVVCRPGGGEPAIWDASTPTYTMRPGEALPAEFTQKFGHWLEQREEEGE
jgi:Family of unknown function (DUF6188)